ncbi:MAG: acetylglutamate kinase [Candidatus Gastranaerophilales bacterium]|nr:acetylglutamate kinase [Candidatus Gastranaerophilales bacterium]
MINYIETAVKKADILIEAMPYINKFHNKIVVVKYGGSAMTDEKIKESTISDIAFMKMVGIKPVIVHGGGPEINAQLKLSNIEPNFVNGIRVTDEKTMKTVEMVLSGQINKSIVSEFQKNNTKAVGISGKDGLLIEAVKKTEGNVDFGFVGDIKDVNPEIINSLIENDFIPVISPVGGDKDGNTYNINADVAAVEIAIKLNAAKLVFLTDIEGIRMDENNPDSLISKIKPQAALDLIKKGNIKGGMIPKTECCVKAVQNGVDSVHIINGKISHSILLEIYTKDGIGTVIEEE